MQKKSLLSTIKNFFFSKKNPPIYKVDVLKINTEKNNWEERFIRDRTWGFYHSLEIAKKAALENWTDMCECNYYNFILVSEMPEGVCITPSRQWWFKASYIKGKNEPLISLYHESLTRKDMKKDPLNKNLNMGGIMGWGW